MRRKRGQLQGRLRDAGMFLAFIFLGILIAARLDYGNTERFSADFHVVDGDTLRSGRERLRLEGIDAPELGQICTDRNGAWDCGEEARLALDRFISRPDFSCSGSSRDRYSRLLVRCTAGRDDAGEHMVTTGLAVATDDTYRRAGQEARNREAGLWSGQFDMPADWRKARERNQETARGAGLLAPLFEWAGW